jgi:hypothetical protein
MRPCPRKTTLTWLALALLTVGSVADLGSVPTMAVIGLASVALYVIPAIVFLVPARARAPSGLPRAGAGHDLRGRSAGVHRRLRGRPIPAEPVGHASVPAYVSALLGGVLLIGVLPPVLLYRLRRPEWNPGSAAAGGPGSPGGDVSDG